MDNEFIGSKELILGGVGIGVALVLLIILSLLQTSRRRREGEERLQALAEDTDGLPDAPPGETPFFVACYNGYNPRFFRVYQGVEELLFVNAGQYFVLIDAESVRGTDGRHWLLRSFRLVCVGLAGGAVAAGIGLAAILRGVARKAADNPEGARDIVLIVLGIIGFLAVMVVVGVPLMLWQVTRRCRQLDPMSLSRLRQEAELDTKSFRATPDTVMEFKVTLLDQQKNFIPSTQVGSTISFKDSVAGRWKILTSTTADTRAALAALRSNWGADCISVDRSLHERLGEPMESPDAEDVAPPTLRKRLAARVKELESPSPSMPRFGFPRYMVIGFLLGAAIGVAVTFALSAGAGRFRYTGLVKMVWALGGLGTYLGHEAGCLRHRALGVKPFRPLTPGIMACGGTIWMLGSIAVFAAVLGIMTLLRGPPPH